MVDKSFFDIEKSVFILEELRLYYVCVWQCCVRVLYVLQLEIAYSLACYTESKINTLYPPIPTT